MPASGKVDNAQAAYRQDRLIMWIGLGLAGAIFTAGPLGNILSIAVTSFDPHRVHRQTGGIAPRLFGLARWH
ncbi:hypothetical protein [Streptomyces sp. NPDC044948]|uniref:hypothetical protein n=1 Tax=Streptomyces sp. NPDC044948 TaxID=3157092 RepID=UPI0033F61113